MLKYCLILLMTWATSSTASKIPESWKICPKTGNEKCLIKAIEEAMMSLKNGNKRLSILPLDPLRLERMEIAQTGGPVSINLTFYDIGITSMSSITVNSAKADWDKHEIEFDFLVNAPNSAIGDYTIDGKILVLPIQGNGKANVTFTGTKGKIEIKGSEYTKDGKKYMKVDDAKYHVDPERVYVYFGNLFNGVPNLGENMNKFLNDNWRVIIDELRETIASALGQTVKQISNIFFQNVPLDQLYKP